jgi:hypothetical protein
MDILEHLREVRSVPQASPEKLDAVRNALVATASAAATVTGTSASPRCRIRRVPQRVLVAAAALVLTGGSVAAWAAVSSQQGPRTMTTIECGRDTYIPVETGDPVLDCYAALANQESPVPSLTGWITPSGLVAVLPAGEAPPLGSRPLPASFQVDAGIRYANDALGDVAGPLQSGCLDPTSAIAYATATLSITDLRDFAVTVDSSSTPYACPSYTPVIDPGRASVELVPTGSWNSSAATNVTVVLDQRLAKQLSDTCTTTGAAEALARSDAGTLGVAPHALLVSDAGSRESSASCATAFVEAGGSFDVVIWQVGGAS